MLSFSQAFFSVCDVFFLVCFITKCPVTSCCIQEIDIFSLSIGARRHAFHTRGAVSVLKTHAHYL